MSDQPICKQWMDKMEGKDAFVQRLFSVFIAEEPKRVEQIRTALAERDTDQLAYLTHSLKGSAATMGAEQLRESCLALELAAREGDVARSDACFEELEERIDEVYAFMKSRLPEAQQA